MKTGHAPAMQIAYAKQEARLVRYRTRAKTARAYARLVMLALMVTVGAAVWQDETYGPQMKQYARLGLEKFEAATDEGSTGRKLVQAAMSTLEL